MAQLGKCARAAPRQAAGRLARGPADLGLSLTSRKGALCPTGGFQNALFRHDATAECAFPSRRNRRMRLSVTLRRPGGVGQLPPPGCGALWRTPQLGKRARATARQPAGRVARGSANLGLESGLTEKRTLPNRWVQNALFRHDATVECAFPLRHSSRMRFSVRRNVQNTLFRRMRLSSPGQTWRRLTEKHILQPTPHGKAHSAGARTGPRRSKFLSSGR